MAYIEMNSRMNFMIVDPVELNATLLKKSLKKIGYNNSFDIRDTFEALKLIKTGNQKLDFILCRYNTPNLNGLEFFQELKADFSIQRLPFTMFSEEMDGADLALFHEEGVDAFLTIPFVNKDLAERIMKTWSRYIDQNNVEFHFEVGRKFLISKKFDEAEQIFKKIINSKQILHRAYTALARVEQKRESLDSVINLCKEALKISPKYVHAHQLLGEAFLGKGDTLAALEAFSTAIEISPKNPYRYQVVGEILLGLQQWDAAEKIYKKALSYEIYFPELIEGLAKSLIQQEKKKEALQYFEKLVEMQPKNALYLNNIAICYKSMNNLDKAIFYYNQALAIQPTDTRVLYNLALTYIGLGNKDKAIETLTMSVKFDPTHEKSKLKLLQLTDPEEYKKYLQNKPSALEQQSEKTSIQNEGEKNEEVSGTVSLDDDVVFESSKQETILDAAVVNNGSKLQAAVKKIKDVASENLSKRKIDDESLKLIQRLDDFASQYYYYSSIRKIRQIFYKLMKAWFGSIAENTEELTLEISEILQEILKAKSNENLSEVGLDRQTIGSTIKAAIENNNLLKEELFPIVTELQIQDYVSQSLKMLENSYRIIFERENPDEAWIDIEKKLISNDHRRLFKKVIKHEEVDDLTQQQTAILF